MRDCLVYNQIKKRKETNYATLKDIHSSCLDGSNDFGRVTRDKELDWR